MDHKLKKKLIRARNKKNQLIFQHAEQHDLQQQQTAEDEARLREKKDPDNTVDEVVFSAKMQKIRNRLTGKKRNARERWNRFAGTAAAGGQGR